MGSNGYEQIHRVRVYSPITVSGDGGESVRGGARQGLIRAGKRGVGIQHGIGRVDRHIRRRTGGCPGHGQRPAIFVCRQFVQ